MNNDLQSQHLPPSLPFLPPSARAYPPRAIALARLVALGAALLCSTAVSPPYL